MAERKPAGAVRCALCARYILQGETRMRTTPDLRSYHVECYQRRPKPGQKR